MLNLFLEYVLRSELYRETNRLLKLLKLLLHVLAYAQLIKVANGANLLYSTQKELSKETLININ